MHFISIFSAQTVAGQTVESEIRVPCKFNCKNNLGLISYEEFTEEEKFSSKIKICSSGTIIITRKSSQLNQFTFEENKHHMCTYYTKFGSFQLGVFTHKINCNFVQNGCYIELYYSLDTNNANLSQNKVIINVWEENDV